jgi:hypothetical protein
MANRHATLINDVYAISEEGGDKPLKIKALVDRYLEDVRVVLEDDRTRIRDALSSLQIDLVIEFTKPETPKIVRELLRVTRDYAGTIQYPANANLDCAL